MAYNMIRNGKCPDGFSRIRWSKLGRTSVSQCSVAIDENGDIFTWGQNVSWESGQGDDTGRLDLSYIEYATQLMPDNSNWIKSSSGEESSMALNDKGELWGWGDQGYPDSSAFGLPTGSGELGGGEFYRPVLCTPGYLWKDFAHCFYYTLAIGLDNKLYTFGRNVDEGLGMALPNHYLQHTPLLNTYLTDDIKLIDCELDANVAVTVDNKVYIWGDGWYYWSALYPWSDWITPTELTGLPVDAVVEQVSCSPYGVIVLLADGTVWAAGEGDMFGDNFAAYPAGTGIFRQVTSIVPKGNVTLVRTTALGAFSVVIIADGNIWSWGDDLDGYMGNTLAYTADIPMLCGAEFEGERVFVDAVHNTHNQVFQAIDNRGYLWTWGWQGWGPHLAIGAAYSEALANQDPNITEIVAFRSLIGYASYALDLQGDPTLHNMPAPSQSEYWQPLGQDLRHRPCGHWHLREFFALGDQPENCWMPALAVDDGILLFAAAGRYAKELPGSGNEVLMFTYDIDANIWTRVMYEEGYQAAYKPGGAAIDSDIYVFANWKQDQIGSRYSETYTNEGIGVWVHNVNTGVMNYTQFLDSMMFLFMKNKTTAYVGGVVAIAYHDDTAPNPQLFVRVSTDYGITWNLRKTVAPNASRKDFSLAIDKDTGYIFLAHQVSATSVMIERSIDNGVTWTTRIASNYLMSSLLEVKLNIDNSTLFLFGSSDVSTAIEISINEGTSWVAQTGEPGASIVGAGTGINDTHSNKAVALIDGDTIHTHWRITYPDGTVEGEYTTYGTIWNYVWDNSYGGYIWLEREVNMLNFDGDNLVANVSQSDASLNGDSGIFAYSSFKFYTGVARHLAVMISIDRGVTWHARETPLAYYEDGEFPEFTGCPLFCITDVPYLNHIWTFEKSNWADRCGFVKQKDKYVSVTSCACIKCK